MTFLPVSVDRNAPPKRWQSFPATNRTFVTALLLLLLWVNTDAVAASPAGTRAVVSVPFDAPLPDGVDQTTGFRMQRYRSPVPTQLPGAETVDTPRAMELLKAGDVVFIDVYPPKGLGPDPLEGYWISNEQHSNIAGSIWLPEVGRGHVEQPHIDYFQRNLIAATNDCKTTPLLFYCTADCWQSWNAARRALLWGYENVFWYPAGTDGWLDYEQPLVDAEPVNFLGD